MGWTTTDQIYPCRQDKLRCLSIHIHIFSCIHVYKYIYIYMYVYIYSYSCMYLQLSSYLYTHNCNIEWAATDQICPCRQDKLR
jgi:hypothetical protein